MRVTELSPVFRLGRDVMGWENLYPSQTCNLWRLRMFVESLIIERPDELRSVTIALVPLHSFRQVFTEQLLCATLCSRCQGYSSDKSPCLLGIHILMGKTNGKQNIKQIT